ncbi:MULTISPECIES: methyltransferase [unclassified Streptomyces]|uniref:methyltransferase n=1 Tax=unclassified Streptomyces TaxID=2593676 RepID=UPI0013173BBB|nr:MULTISPECIES: methyltransferase [unclassified Streptomyces]QHC31815.1 methyltransferase [Streptomyces sp. HF10]WKE69208.1 methyltransferase [Streptomyces sp. WP-1]
MAADLDWLKGEVTGDVITYTHPGGLTVRAERGEKKDRLRILPLTRLQAALLDHLTAVPALAAGKRVFEPFAGSGAFGFMALRLGARHVDLLDINPRAAQFHRATTAANGFPPDRVTSHTADIRTHRTGEPYDLVLANPPFLPTPDCIAGTLNSNGGPEGNTLVEVLLERLPELLRPEGHMFVILYQLIREGMPLVARAARRHATGRPMEFTLLQETPVPFEVYVDAYERRHPADRTGIRQWHTDLVRRHGTGLSLAHLVMHVGARTAAPGSCVVRNDAAGRFGSAYLLAEDDPDYLPVDGRRH